MKSEWRVTCNYICGGLVYNVYRLRDLDEIDHSGNREYVDDRIMRAIERMMQRKDEFLAVMQKTMAERGYTLMILMLTDVLLEGTHLLYLGDEDIITQAFGVQLKDHTCFLPGVVSRKKQVIPMLTALWG